MFCILVILIYLQFIYLLNTSKLLGETFHCNVETYFDAGTFVL